MNPTELELASLVERIDGVLRPAAQGGGEAEIRELAMALDHAQRLQLEGAKPESAVETAQEGLVWTRALEEASPGGYRLHLAGTLGCVAAALHAAGRFEACIEALEESAEILRGEFAEQDEVVDPGRFAPFVGTLFNLSNRLAEAERTREARDVAQEALDRLLPKFRAQPEPFAPLAQAVTSIWVERHQELGEDPDEVRLAEVQAVFSSLERESDSTD